MPGRYTSKIRAKRIDLHYFKRLHPFRRWKLILTIAVPAVAAAWLIVLAARGDQRVYTSGPVSTGHAMFNIQCGQCHEPARAEPGKAAPAGSGFWLRASDRTCLKCHDGPIHHESQTFDPTCTTCHVEHKGHVVLASISSQHCTRCHADLKSKGPATTFERKIESFTTNHPEFAVTVKEGDRALRVRLDDRERLKDTAQVKLNHQKHLKPGLKGLDALKAQRGMTGLVENPKGLQLACTFCHQPDSRQAYMAPINYTKHCGPGCHPLDFDPKLPDVAVPHDTPAIVHAFLRATYTEAFEACQTLARQADDTAPSGLKKQCQQLELVKGDAKDEEAGDRPRARIGQREEPAEEERPRARIGGRRDEPEDKAAPEQWVPTQLKNAESLLFKQKCEYCHTLAYAREKLPVVAATAIPVRWMPHSRFDHGAHRPLACVECHKATQSIETKDVLLPSIASCRECHRSSAGARSGCVECHLYHDKAKARDLNGPFTVRELVMGVPAPRGGATPKSGSVNGSR